MSTAQFGLLAVRGNAQIRTCPNCVASIVMRERRDYMKRYHGT
jgi:hypothetical protein